MSIVVALPVVASVAGAVERLTVAREHRAAQVVATPLTMAAVVAIAATVGDAHADVRFWLDVGEILGLVISVMVVAAWGPVGQGSSSAPACVRSVTGCSVTSDSWVRCPVDESRSTSRTTAVGHC